MYVLRPSHHHVPSSSPKSQVTPVTAKWCNHGEARPGAFLFLPTARRNPQVQPRRSSAAFPACHIGREAFIPWQRCTAWNIMSFASLLSTVGASVLQLHDAVNGKSNFPWFALRRQLGTRPFQERSSEFARRKSIQHLCSVREGGESEMRLAHSFC